MEKAKGELEAAVSSPTKPMAEYDFEDPPIPEKDIFFRKPVFMLVDRVCASACEIAVLFMKRHPFMKTAGENTSGDLLSNQTSMAVLPNSRIRIWFGDVYREFYGEIADRVGLAPDIRVPKGLDALEFVLQEIKRPGVR